MFLSILRYIILSKKVKEKKCCQKINEIEISDSCQR